MELQAPNRTAPSPEEVRRKLEGGLELLEQALPCVEDLEARLRRVEKKSAWKRALSAHLPLVQEVARGHSEVVEALRRLERRAQVEGWPEKLPALALARRLEALQARLKERLERRLGLPAPAEGLDRLLHQLQALLVEEVPGPRSPEETLLLHGGWSSSERNTLALGLLLGPLLCCLPDSPWVHILHQFLGSGGPVALYAAWALTVLLAVLGSRHRLGSYWLTSERLVWEPMGGDPQQVLLRSIPLAGVKKIGTLTLQVLDEKGKALRFSSWRSSEVARQVELHRRLPLLGARRAPRPYAAMCLKGEARQGKSPVRQGLLLFLRGRVLFMPINRGEQVLACFSGQAQQPSVEYLAPLFVFQHLRWLPAELFEACLQRVMQTPGILSFRVEELELQPPRGLVRQEDGTVLQPLYPGLELRHGEVSLFTLVMSGDRAMVLQLLGMPEVEAAPPAAKDASGT